MATGTGRRWREAVTVVKEGRGDFARAPCGSEGLCRTMGSVATALRRHFGKAREGLRAEAEMEGNRDDIRARDAGGHSPHVFAHALVLGSKGEIEKLPHLGQGRLFGKTPKQDAGKDLMRRQRQQPCSTKASREKS
ncbi:hypothetical protein ERJ75_000914400 [Trypanosoma vivax]|nr:hypothetical protein ERJ75_000914400 [Trypanosoma vivax]